MTAVAVTFYLHLVVGTPSVCSYAPTQSSKGLPLLKIIINPLSRSWEQIKQSAESLKTSKQMRQYSSQSLKESKFLSIS